MNPLLAIAVVELRGQSVSCLFLLALLTVAAIVGLHRAALWLALRPEPATDEADTFTAELQVKIGLIRIYLPGDSYGKGSPHVFAIQVTSIGDAAFIEGLTARTFTPGHWRAIRAELRAWGCWRWAEWERVKAGGPVRRIRRSIA